MGKGFSAVLPVVVIRVIADLLVNRLLGIEIVGGILGRGGRGCHGLQPIQVSLRLLKLESAAAATHLHGKPALQITAAESAGSTSKSVASKSAGLESSPSKPPLLPDPYPSPLAFT